MSGAETQRAPGSAEQAPGPKVETSDVPAAWMGMALAAVAATLLLVCAAVAGLFLLFDRIAPPPGGAVEAALIPPEPRLQIDEPVQRAALERRAAKALQAAPDRVGIEEAMRRVAARGWPDEARR